MGKDNKGKLNFKPFRLHLLPVQYVWLSQRSPFIEGSYVSSTTVLHVTLGLAMDTYVYISRQQAMPSVHIARAVFFLSFETNNIERCRPIGKEVKASQQKSSSNSLLTAVPKEYLCSRYLFCALVIVGIQNRYHTVSRSGVPQARVYYCYTVLFFVPCFC